MHRFIALIWNHADPEQTACALDIARRLSSDAPEWACALDADGLRIFHTGAREKASSVYLLKHGGGALVGKLFRRGSEYVAPVTIEFDGREADLILGSRGRHLITHYWGRYVAFLNDTARKSRIVLRDPGGAFPCFVMRWQCIDVFFSRIEDLCSLGFFRFSVNWDYVAAHLVHDQLRIRRTGLNEVLEVLPGECIETDGDRSTREFFWHPAQISSDNIIENGNEAARDLKRTTCACVGAWASAYDRIVHELSGGLDSAIVLGCLVRAPVRPDIACLNVFTERAEGDERAFARTAAKDAGVPLVETEIRSSQTTLKRILELPRLARPHFSTIGLMMAEAYTDLARSHGAQAFFSGQGGDHLFHQRKTPLVAADYIRRHGLDRRFLSVLSETARSTRRSMWRVGGDAISHGLLRHARSRRRTDPSCRTGFLAADVFDAMRDDDLVHPWLATSGDVPPAKLLHIADLIDLQSYYFPFGRAAVADLVFPLFSQPLIELCLRIPTYVLTEGGGDRPLARRAFREMVRASILARTTKGDITGFYNAVLSREIELLRALLLEGVLADQKLLDRAPLERYLTDDRVVRGDKIIDIMSCLGVEAWARAWTDAGMKAAA